MKGILLTGFAILGITQGIHHIVIKEKAFAYAQALASIKGIINLGAGPHRTLLADDIANAPEVVLNVDIVPDGLPDFMELDIEAESLPFPDKTFDCAFMSHVIEHLEDWEFALAEAIRVADSVVVVLPHPLSIVSWFNPAHRQHFSINDIREIESIFPSVTIFY